MRKVFALIFIFLLVGCKQVQKADGIAFADGYAYEVVVLDQSPTDVKIKVNSPNGYLPQFKTSEGIRERVTSYSYEGWVAKEFFCAYYTPKQLILELRNSKYQIERLKERIEELETKQEELSPKTAELESVWW